MTQTANFIRGYFIADKTHLALQHYQHSNFNEEDRVAIQGGLNYISKVKIAEDIAKGKITGRFSVTGEELRKVTNEAIKDVESFQDITGVRLSLRTIEEILGDVNAEKVDRKDSRLNATILIFRRIRDVLQSKSSIPIETVNIQEHYW